MLLLITIFLGANNCKIIVKIVNVILTSGFYVRKAVFCFKKSPNQKIGA